MCDSGVLGYRKLEPLLLKCNGGGQKVLSIRHEFCLTSEGDAWSCLCAFEASYPLPLVEYRKRTWRWAISLKIEFSSMSDH
jgi:hypothetical protein